MAPRMLKPLLMVLLLVRAMGAAPVPPLQVRTYDDRTYILREGLGVTREAPFLYLLVGRDRALLIDTGDVADPAQVPLAATVLGLLPGEGAGRLPLLVVHSHGHLDHRAGDPQFAGLPGVQVVPSDLEAVRTRFGFARWPEGVAQLDLGDRILDILPAPGHHRAQLVFYDRATRLVFSGDYLLPGRILVDDLAAYRVSADRVAAFLRDKEVRAVLGGHIEQDRAGNLFPWGAEHHPDERDLALGKAEVLALPAALRDFHGLYARSGPFVVEHPVHLLMVLAAALLLALAGLGFAVYRLLRRRRAARS